MLSKRGFNELITIYFIIIFRTSAVSYNQPKIPSLSSWSPHAVTFASESIIGSQYSNVFVDSNNDVYIATSKTSGYLVWRNGSTDPKQIEPEKSWQLKEPHAIFVINDKKIVASDTQGKHYVKQWILDDYGKIITGVDEQVDAKCDGLFVDVQDYLYCSMPDAGKIIKVKINTGTASLTVFERREVEEGRGNSAFEFTLEPSSMYKFSPTGIFVDTDLNLYVADVAASNIQLFLKGQSNGKIVAGCGSPYPTIDLSYPTGVILDVEKNLFITDNGNNRIVRSGRYGSWCIAGCSGSSGSESNQLNYPTSLSFDNVGNIFVVDHGNNRIQKFSLLADVSPITLSSTTTVVTSTRSTTLSTTTTDSTTTVITSTRSTTLSTTSTTDSTTTIITSTSSTSLSTTTTDSTTTVITSTSSATPSTTTTDSTTTGTISISSTTLSTTSTSDSTTTVITSTRSTTLSTTATDSTTSVITSTSSTTLSTTTTDSTTTVITSTSSATPSTTTTDSTTTVITSTSSTTLSTTSTSDSTTTFIASTSSTTPSTTTSDSTTTRAKSISSATPSTTTTDSTTTVIASTSSTTPSTTTTDSTTTGTTAITLFSTDINILSPNIFLPKPCKNSTTIGLFCNVSNTMCDLMQPCHHNSICRNDGSQPKGYICECLDDSHDSHCLVNHHPCQSNPCQHNGTCNKTSNTTFDCLCASGWHGRYCETMDNFCDGSKCQNNAVCRPLVGTYKCECLGDDFSGPFCEITATKIKVLRIVSKSFGYVAIIALISVAMFIVIMDILKYCFGIDPVHEERERLRQERRAKNRKPVIERVVYVNAPTASPSSAETVA